MLTHDVTDVFQQKAGSISGDIIGFYDVTMVSWTVSQDPDIMECYTVRS